MIFAATPEGLRAAFIGCKRPLPEPVLKTIANPFTGEPLVQPCWFPDPADQTVYPPAPGRTLAQRLQALPHVEIEGLDELVCAALLAAVNGGDERAWQARVGNPPALIDPREPSHEWHVWELPPQFTEACAALSPARASEIVQRLTESEAIDWSPAESAQILDRIADLAREAKRRAARLHGWM